jgi:hypothetical protein
MAAIASTLEADFTDYVAETQKANAAMNDMQREADGVSSAVGGAAASMNKLGGAASSSYAGINTMSSSLRTADKTLSAFGMNIGPQIQALEEMESVAGKTAGEIGILGTAMSVAGAAMAGWNIGRWIADMTGADAKIADLAASFMGWGSTAQQTAEYQKDLIIRAQQLDPAVRTAAQAFTVLNNAAKAQAETFNTGADRLRTWKNDLNDANTDQAKLRAEIEAGNSTVAQMSSHYHASAEAIQYLQREMAKESQTRKEAETAAKAHADALAEVNQAVTGQDALLESLTDSERAATEAALAAGIAQGTVAKAYGLTAPQVRAVADAMKEAEKAVKDFDAAQKIATDANQKWNDEIAANSLTTTGRLIADIDAWKAEAIAALDETGGATEAHYNTISQIAAEKMSQVKLNWDVLRDGAIANYADIAARAEATYQEMLAHSTQYTTGAIEQARLVRDETLATFNAMNSAHSAAVADFYKRDQAYAAALKQFRTEAATATETAYQKEAAALDAAIAYSQTYAVTITEAQKALGQLGDSGEQAGQRTTQAMAAASAQVGQLTAVVQQSASQMETLARYYDQMANQTMQGGGTGLGWSPFQMGENYQESAAKLRAKAGRQAQFEEAMNPSTWGTRGMTASTTNLSVNVNNQDAQGIANKLIEELRHNGVRFG